MLTINNTLDGYLKDVEILGNTIQNEEDLADIRSVGDKVEGQELYEIPVLCTNGLEDSDSNYHEHKLTILSPVQLEKVGDVADRIVCKDGVWGVEKNVITKVYDGTESWELSTSDSNTNQKYCTLKNENSFVTSTSIKGINNRFIYGNPYSQSGICLAVINNQIRVRTFNGDETLDGFKANLKELNLIVKYPASQPTFSPLPHDQQVKLRTFANKTNISFLTEIEGTIKAQVPKSLGATVNTHTEQINNLNKELDRVKKLEESTVSTVETESDFTTVEQTTNGYFEDVKLEGKTLVVNSDNEVVEPGTEGAILKSVGQDVEEVSVASVNSDETQSDKKRLLYYNNETQTWEKPILREWDSIEKHSDGKYYYHQRSGEVVLNGSEDWNNDKNSSTISPETYRQSIQFDTIDMPSASFNTKTSPNIISDLLPTVIFSDVYSYNHIGISISDTDSIGTHIIINNNFIDVTELKQWLQANNLTVVYQLAEEKVYECTNIDLITYEG